jgi:hypothetical protein
MIAKKFEGLLSYSERYCYYVHIVECIRRHYYFWYKIWTYSSKQHTTLNYQSKTDLSTPKEWLLRVCTCRVVIVLAKE